MINKKQDNDIIMDSNSEDILMNDVTGGAERRSEGWDISHIFKNYFFLAGSQIGSALLSFATVWIATRYFKGDGYGGIVAILSGAQVMLIFINWPGVALSRHGVEEFVGTGKITNAFVSRSFIWVLNLILLVATSFFWMPLIIKWLKLDTAAATFIIIYFISAAIWLNVQNSLQAAKLLRLQGLLLLTERAIILVMIICIANFGKGSWLYASMAYISAALMAATIGIIKLRHYISFPWTISRHWIKKILLFSLPLFPYTITNFFSTNYLDAFFITKYLSKSDLGIYSVAYQVSGVLLQFPVLVGSLLMPLFVTLKSRNRENVINIYIQEVLPVLTFFWGILSVFIALLCCLLIPLLFGKEFVGANKVVWVLLLGSTFVFPSFVGYSPFITASAAVFISFPMAIITASTNLIGNSLLIPRLGLFGSSLATALSYLASLLFIIIVVHKKYKLSNTWQLQAVFPSVISILYFTWRGYLFEGFIVSILCSIIIFFFNRRIIYQAIQKALLFRKSFQ